MSIIIKENAMQTSKFQNQFITASGDVRASVDFKEFDTLGSTQGHFVIYLVLIVT